MKAACLPGIRQLRLHHPASQTSLQHQQDPNGGQEQSLLQIPIFASGQTHWRHMEMSTGQIPTRMQDSVSWETKKCILEPCRVAPHVLSFLMTCPPRRPHHNLNTLHIEQGFLSDQLGLLVENWTCGIKHKKGLFFPKMTSAVMLPFSGVLINNRDIQSCHSFS